MFVWGVVSVGLLGCGGEEVGEFGVTEAPSQLRHPDDTSAVLDSGGTLSACWIIDEQFSGSGSPQPSTVEQNAMAQIEEWIDEGWVRHSGLSIEWNGLCSSYDEELRVYLDHVTGNSSPQDGVGGDGVLSTSGSTTVPTRDEAGIVPPSGENQWGGTCTLSSPNGGSWAMFPAKRDDTGRENCLYNMYLTTREWNGGPWQADPSRVPPWRAHYLHEFGHAFGLAHEHERSDDDNFCGVSATYDGWYLTKYDPDSVMHYSYVNGVGGFTCTTDGNYSSEALNWSDKLGIQMLYPVNYYQDISGQKVVPVGSSMAYTLSWADRGAYMGEDGQDGAFLEGFSWKTAYSVLSDGDGKPTVTWDADKTGEAILWVNFQDALGRGRVGRKTVEVLAKDAFTARFLPVWM